jgi:hypothetical protein
MIGRILFIVSVLAVQNINLSDMDGIVVYIILILCIFAE